MGGCPPAWAKDSTRHNVHEHKFIPISSLLLDSRNPRLGSTPDGQAAIFERIMKVKGGTVLALTEDIASNGLNPSDLTMVIADAIHPNKYIVLEGNRRLSALQALCDPTVCEGLLTKPRLSKLQKDSRKFLLRQERRVHCVQFSAREEARHWILLKHTGQNRGAGVVDWDAGDKRRFESQGDTPPLEMQILDLLHGRGAIPAETLRGFPTSTLKRLLSTPEVRTACGISSRDGVLELLAGDDSVSALTAVVKELADPNTSVGSFYTAKQRRQYATFIATRTPLRNAREPGGGDVVDPAAPPADAAQDRPSRRARRKGPRSRLIPSDCLMKISHPRIRNIAEELASIKVDSHPNAVSILLRVFVELSADCFLEKHREIKPHHREDREASLAAKLKAIAEHLVKDGVLDKDSAAPVRASGGSESFLSPSMPVMHAFMHNRHMFPAPGDLRANWDRLQPFMQALWK